MFVLVFIEKLAWVNKTQKIEGALKTSHLS